MQKNDQVSPAETLEIIRLATKVLQAKVKGDFVELGCYRGETSVLLQKLLKESGELVEKNTPENSTARKLWIYDSFEGLPEKTREDASSAGDAFRAGELLVSKREVIEKFKRANLPLPVIKKGFFENLVPEKDLPKHIAFAFLDGDLYSSIKTSFSLVLPRLSEQGIILVHDYNNPELPGAAKAVDEFLQKNPAFRPAQKYTLVSLTR